MKTMAYEIRELPLEALFGPVTRATEALARLDERLARSPVREGFVERQHFADAAAALWLEGELMHLEDLVLHDAHMDIRTPTHELTRAHAVLRIRRRIFAQKRDWALSRDGFLALTGRGGAAPASRQKSREGQATETSAVEADGQNDAEDDLLAEEFAGIDAVLARSSKILMGADVPAKAVRPDDRPDLIYDLDWNEEERLAEWQDVIARTRDLPVVAICRSSCARQYCSTPGPTSRCCSTVLGSGRRSWPRCCGGRVLPPTISPACTSAPKTFPGSAGGHVIVTTVCWPSSIPSRRRRWPA
jgi:hypothetical protein